MVNRILFGKKSAHLLATRTAQGEERFAIWHKTTREFRGRSVVVRLTTAAQIKDERVDFFAGETAHGRVHLLELLSTQVAGTQISDAVGDNLAIKWRGRDVSSGAARRQEHDAAAETAEQTREGRAIQFLLVEGGGVDVVGPDDRNRLLQVRRVEGVQRRGRRSGRCGGGTGGG